MKAIISDLGGVLLFPKDRNYKGKLNPIYKEESQKSDFNFFDHFELNTELLKYYFSLKENGVKLYIITEGNIQNDPKIKNNLDRVFTEIFSSEKLGLSKKESELYTNIVAKLNLESSDVIYIDDNEENIDAAVAAGLEVVKYRNNQDLILKLPTKQK